MISCENSSFVFVGTERLHSTTATKTTAVSGHTTAATIFAGIPSVASFSSAQSTLLAYNYGDSRSYTERYAQDTSVLKEEEVLYTNTTKLHISADGVPCSDVSADENDTLKEISSNDVPTPVTSSATTLVYEEMYEQTTKLASPPCEEKDYVADNKEKDEKENDSHFVKSSFQSALLNEKQLDSGSSLTSFCNRDNIAVCAVNNKKEAEKKSEEEKSTKSGFSFPLSVGRLLQPKIDVDTAYLAVTLFLENLCHDNEQQPVLTSDFHSHRIPSMSVECYVDRIVRYSQIGGETLIVSLMLLLKYSHFIEHPVSIYNFHRLMITSALLGAKLRDDTYYSNEYYSRIGGIPNFELNKLELRFCTLLEWDMWVDETEYETLETLLIRLAEEVNIADKNKDTVNRKDIERQFWINYLLPWKEKYELACTVRRDYIKKSLEVYSSNDYANNTCVTTPAKGFFSTDMLTDRHGKVSVCSPEKVTLPEVYTRSMNGLVERDQLSGVTAQTFNVFGNNSNNKSGSSNNNNGSVYHSYYHNNFQQQQQWSNCVGAFNGNGNAYSGGNTNGTGREFGIMGRAVHSISTFTNNHNNNNNNNNNIATSTTAVSSVSKTGISIDAESYYYGGSKLSTTTSALTSRPQHCKNTTATLCGAAAGDSYNSELAVNYGDNKNNNNNNNNDSNTDDSYGSHGYGCSIGASVDKNNNNNKIQTTVTTTTNDNHNKNNKAATSSGNTVLYDGIFHSVNSDKNNDKNNDNSVISAVGGVYMSDAATWQKVSFNPKSTNNNNTATRSFIFSSSCFPSSSSQPFTATSGETTTTATTTTTTAPTQRVGTKRQKPDHYKDCR